MTGYLNLEKTVKSATRVLTVVDFRRHHFYRKAPLGYDLETKQVRIQHPGSPRLQLQREHGHQHRQE
jgi:hypothetical protein